MDLNVVIKDRKKLIFKGVVASLTSYNDVGEFDVLSSHANFVSLINSAIILNKNLPQEERIAIEKAVMEVTNNDVQIFVQ